MSSFKAIMGTALLVLASSNAQSVGSRYVWKRLSASDGNSLSMGIHHV
jgi:hypothetical protein